jgi:riboflavin synthase
MFSGIVSEVGTVQDVGDGRLRVRAQRVLLRAQVGGSVAVNGVCLTASEISDGGFAADVMPETLRRTSLGALGPGSQVNLEAPLGFGEEVGGHLVQGHVDATGEVVAVAEDGNARVCTIRVPQEVQRYCVEKGSIAVDGVSLTIVSIAGDAVEVSLIPHTLESTIASGYHPGSIVNLEADILAKYVARYVGEVHPGSTAPPPGGSAAGTTAKEG